MIHSINIFMFTCTIICSGIAETGVSVLSRTEGKIERCSFSTDSAPDSHGLRSSENMYSLKRNGSMNKRIRKANLLSIEVNFRAEKL